MKRFQTISPVYTKYTLLLCAVLVFSSTAAFANETVTLSTFHPKIGTHYKQLDTPLVNSDDQQIILFCWLGSPSCYQLESALNDWARDSGYQVSYKPLIKRPQWRMLAKARLVARLMAQETLVAEAIYKRIHEEQLAISSEEELFMLIESLGISASRFANLFYSPELNASLKEYELLSQKLALRGVPSLVVGNEFLLDASMLKTTRKFLYTLEFVLGLTESP